MADFYISGIRRDSAGQHIQFVRIIQAGKRSTDATINSRKFVAELISTGKVIFKTITYVNGQWVYGVKVHVIEGVFLTTDPNSTTRDNLGNLPVF
ncbi:DUF3892 domain-containing protein [Pantoea ananatis]|uniref:DUF3892 domain-containing protein n=1 Tax=Pantoea ananas TaxID=553 RepID=UPI003FA4B34D